MVDKSITFDELQFTSHKDNYFDVMRIQITDTLGTVGTSFNPVDITNNGNIPEYILFDIAGVDPENVYSVSSPGTAENIDRNGNVNWDNINNVKTQDNSYGSNTIEILSPTFVKSVEHVELTLSGVTSNYAILTKDQNLDNCVPFVSQKINTAGDDWDENMIDSVLKD